ncbi:hypothetical protein [Saccharothrix sp. NRRL B-16314]|nr:hypothetical protein [Saccharothrix sp. NRRL B-16314]
MIDGLVELAELDQSNEHFIDRPAAVHKLVVDAGVLGSSYPRPRMSRRVH